MSDVDELIEWLGEVENELKQQYSETLLGQSTYRINGEEYSAEEVHKVRMAISNLRQMAEDGAWKDAGGTGER